ncbi:MAG TPA: family 16 glycoside hydrolase, partial [Rhizomicrobium sp.]|nr:family 16 glycoside hydrolase [Rhizomicrobium sp.]
MKNVFLMGLSVAASFAFAAPALTQDSGVNPAELKQIMAQHPDWAVWLADPALAKLTLDGPKMPNSNWRADDIRRPQPPFVETGKACAAPPPGDADILFDGHDLSKWTGDHFGEWSVKDGILTTGAHIYNFLHTKDSYGDAQIHVEFREPAQPHPPVNPQYHG